MTPDLSRRLEELNIQLPVLAPPRFAYVPAVRAGDLVFFSGRTPLVEGQVVHPGRLGAELTVATGQLAARTATVNMLAAIEQEVGLEQVAQLVKMTGFVACTPDFTDQATVVNAASNLLLDVFGAAGQHARSAIGVAALPAGAAVEIELTLRCAAERA